LPVDPQTLPASSAQITGLACPKRTVCYARMTRARCCPSGPAGPGQCLNTDPNGHLIAISCPSTKFCLTVDAEGFAIPQSHGTWGTPALVGTGTGTLTSVSCANSSFCAAVDNIGVAFTYRGSGHRVEPANGRPERQVAELGLLRQFHLLRGGKRER